MPPLRIALTGGIASGKTTVSNKFAALGVPVIDADIAAREVVKNGSDGLKLLVEQFGPSILSADGELNRRALRDVIFSDPNARETVNQILHPLIRDHMRKEAAHMKSPYCLFVIPLLLESGQAGEYDRIVVVQSDRAIRLRRLCERDKISAADAEKILAAQADDVARLEIADHIIQNNDDSSALDAQINTLHQLFLTMASTE